MGLLYKTNTIPGEGGRGDCTKSSALMFSATAVYYAVVLVTVRPKYSNLEPFFSAWKSSPTRPFRSIAKSMVRAAPDNCKPVLGCAVHVLEVTCISKKSLVGPFVAQSFIRLEHSCRIVIKTKVTENGLKIKATPFSHSCWKVCWPPTYATRPISHGVVLLRAQKVPAGRVSGYLTPPVHSPLCLLG
jgi:hypothetical protein